MTEDEMVGWYLWLSRHEFVQALGFGDGQGSVLTNVVPTSWGGCRDQSGVKKIEGNCSKVTKDPEGRSSMRDLRQLSLGFSAGPAHFSRSFISELLLS